MVWEYINMEEKKTEELRWKLMKTKKRRRYHEHLQELIMSGKEALNKHKPSGPILNGEERVVALAKYTTSKDFLWSLYLNTPLYGRLFGSWQDPHLLQGNLKFFCNRFKSWSAHRILHFLHNCNLFKKQQAALSKYYKQASYGWFCYSSGGNRDSSSKAVSNI